MFSSKWYYHSIKLTLEPLPVRTVSCFVRYWIGCQCSFETEFRGGVQGTDLCIIYDYFLQRYFICPGIIPGHHCAFRCLYVERTWGGVYKSSLRYFLIQGNFDLAKIPVRFLESRSYSIGVTAVVLRQHLLDMNALFNRWPVFRQCMMKIEKIVERKQLV